MSFRTSSLRALASLAVAAGVWAALPGGPTRAEACSGGGCTGVNPAWVSFAQTTGGSTVPREGALVTVVTSSSSCPGAPDPTKLSVAARRADGVVVPGSWQPMQTPTPADEPQARWVFLWKASALLEPSTAYTLELISTTTGEMVATVPIVTWVDPVMPPALTVKASIGEAKKGSSSICCVEGTCILKSRCLNAVQEYQARLAVTVTPPGGGPDGFVRYTVRDATTSEVYATLNGWAGETTSTTDIGPAANVCVVVDAQMILTGQTVSSDKVCPPPVAHDASREVRCDEIAALVASCPLTSTSHLDTTSFPEVAAWCHFGEGGAGGMAGAAPAGGRAPAAATPTDDASCSIARAPQPAVAWYAVAAVVAWGLRRRRGSVVA